MCFQVLHKKCKDFECLGFASNGKVLGRGCNVSTMVLGSVAETGLRILMFYTLWFWGCNKGSNGSGPLMGPGTMCLAHVGPMRLGCLNLLK